MEETDILVAGGGIAGMSAAARFAADGHNVILADPVPERTPPPDQRTTAYLQPAMTTLGKAGVWEALQQHGTALATMRIIDAGGITRQVRETADFTAQTAGHDVFGWNVPNMPARAALLNALKTAPNVRLSLGTGVSDYVGRTDRAIVRLTDGNQIRARLVVAADGRDSTLRSLAGLQVRRWEYGQHAQVFAVTHRAQHENVSTEIHRTGGPLTMVPMPDYGGKPCSAVVWMTPSSRAMHLKALSDDEIAAELTAETMGLYSTLTVVGARSTWPIISQFATSLIAQRLVLIAEAAHVMPPIGAQGLNTSLHDIETLAGLFNGQADPGAQSLLDRYQRRILPRTMMRIAGIDLLNRAALARSQPLRDLRRAGLAMLSRVGPLKALATRTGLGVS